MPHEIIFFILAAGAILFAALTISARTVVYSAICFVLTLFATAGIYLQLHAPLLFAAQLIAIFCVVAALILFAVEVSKLDVALANECHWRAKAAAIIATVVGLLEIAFGIAQHHFLPGERLTVLLPKASFPWPLTVADILKYFLSYDLLPLAMMALATVIATVGIRAVFRRRA
jgi:NADH:ubiquinone oxidoreductase subunit 6 (subunit J)